MPAIAAGLCQGVARNICNTLFHGIELFPPIVMVGGASKNKRLVHYLEEEIHLHLHLQSPPDSEYMGGIGAALTAIRLNNNLKQRPTVEVNSLLHRTIFPKSCYYPPLSETKGRIPNFSGRQSYMHMQHEVEVDIYEKLSKHTVLDCYLGIYAGSTSTKVTLMNSRKAVVAGLYTRTSG